MIIFPFQEPTLNHICEDIATRGNAYRLQGLEHAIFRRAILKSIISTKDIKYKLIKKRSLSNDFLKFQVTP